MRQPEPLDAIDELRFFLDFAVPLCGADIAYKLRQWGHSREQAKNWLRGEAERAGGSLGENGDVLQFSDGRPRSGRAQNRVVRTASELARGVAAAALLAQLEGKSGVEAFGSFYGVTAGPAEADTARVQDGEDGAVGGAAGGTCPVRRPAA
ncbi:hypothetical protein GCM10010269_79430 [Streptomyces humidus]|uniref:Uncharacterized protein n=1 Tax=Streptomyces humidus TaxID=52259 RepID=A0A918GCC5_9ACTN|nr:hypothetical protein [Streptomyces humidus]GGS28825.1 hypothetical protein GCM10010269_79430 [Streptomyces humidus]